MKGGTAYLLKTTYPFSDFTKACSLYLYVKVYQDTVIKESTLTLGMYITIPNGLSVGPCADLGNSYLAGVPFDGSILNAAGKWWLVSGVTMTVSHDDAGDATANIPWSWNVDNYGSAFIC